MTHCIILILYINILRRCIWQSEAIIYLHCHTTVSGIDVLSSHHHTMLHDYLKKLMAYSSNHIQLVHEAVGLSQPELVSVGVNWTPIDVSHLSLHNWYHSWMAAHSQLPSCYATHVLITSWECRPEKINNSVDCSPSRYVNILLIQKKAMWVSEKLKQ